MGTSLRGAGCGGAGGVTAASTAGGPILLHVAARRARGDGWESWGVGRDTAQLETGACAKRLQSKSVKERVHAIARDPARANETPLIKETA